MTYFRTLVVLLISGAYAENASVYLMTHNLETPGAVSNFFATAFSITSQGAKHWAVVVQFQNDSLVYVCELHRNTTQANTAKGSGEIMGGCKPVTKDEAVRGKKGIRMHPLKDIDVTPDVLITMANSISYNGEAYHLILRNCQHWANELLEKLGLSTDWFNAKGFLEKKGPGWFISAFMQMYNNM